MINQMSWNLSEEREKLLLELTGKIMLKEMRLIDIFKLIVEQDAEFIRRLKTHEASKTLGGYESEHILIAFGELDKLCGDKLIDSPRQNTGSAEVPGKRSYGEDTCSHGTKGLEKSRQPTSHVGGACKNCDCEKDSHPVLIEDGATGKRRTCEKFEPQDEDKIIIKPYTGSPAKRIQELEKRIEQLIGYNQTQAKRIKELEEAQDEDKTYPCLVCHSRWREFSDAIDCCKEEAGG